MASRSDSISRLSPQDSIDRRCQLASAHLSYLSQAHHRLGRNASMIRPDLHIAAQLFDCAFQAVKLCEHDGSVDFPGMVQLLGRGFWGHLRGRRIEVSTKLAEETSSP